MNHDVDSQPGCDNLSAYLDDAQRRVVAVPQRAGRLSVAEAYAVQHALIERRLGAGESLVGLKLGFTSEAKMQQMGVSEIIVGHLTSAMQVGEAETVDLTALIHPRIEPEVAFLVSPDYREGDGVPESVVAVAPGLEIIDSRYRDFVFTLPDVIADNTSAARFVVGPWTPVGDVHDLDRLDVDLKLDGETQASGSTSAIMGDPMRALAALTDLVDRHGFPLAAGQVVLAGAATEAVPFGPGRYEATVSGLGYASVRAER